MKLLIVEDEAELRRMMTEFLASEGYLVEVAADYESAVEKMLLYQYECILLDITLPGGSGMQLLRSLRYRADTTPVLIISAKGSIEDKVEGLDLGADDYLSKPFHLAELYARVKSAIRRNNKLADNKLHYSNLVLKPDERTAYVDDQEIPLNRKEYDILYYFMLRPEKLVQKSMLAESIWGDSVDQVDRLDFIYSQIKNLRKKIRDKGATVDLQSVYGVGYKLVTAL